MDVRGVEVTNQLRSAIRAKLLELSVQYDDELPDYILVMVVNKKSRKQMHEDLYLFLDESTTPFVDWLHDQVLKKLQKVSIAKKKPTGEFVPTAIKHEEKKKKQIVLPTDNLKIKEEQSVEKPLTKSSQTKEKSVKETREIQKDSLHNDNVQSKVPTAPTLEMPDKSINIIEECKERVGNLSPVSKQVLIESNTPHHSEKEYESAKTSLDSKKIIEEEDIPEKKNKSSINKPRIASVVSIKNRLGVTPYRKPFDSYGDKNKDNDFDNHSKNEKKWDKPFHRPLNREYYRRRNFNEDLSYNTNHNKTNNRQTFPNNRCHVAKQVEQESNKRSGFNAKSRGDVPSGNIKDRLGIVKPKFTEKFNDNSNDVRSRFSAVKRKFQALEGLGSSSVNHDHDINREHDSYQKVSRISGKKEQEDDQDKNIPIKSHIIAVSTFMKEKTERQALPSTEQELSEEETEKKASCDTKCLGSKIIVTPRPLKPLQPVLKRATQSLLFRAINEANQSVVKQKNPEPSILEKKSVFKRLQSSSGTKAVDQNLSVRLNPTKRFVMEKIQIELTNPESDTKSELDMPIAVTDEQIDVVMSLFQRSDDTQKFLVTLNGYDTTKDQQSADEEPMEITITENDEHVSTNSSSESSTQNEPDSPKLPEHADISESLHEHENNENLNIIEEAPRKRWKLSPITYSRSPSPIFQEKKLQNINYLEKQSPAVILNGKVIEKCRYWPNCTLGAKCPYLHTPEPRSSFSAANFDTYIYKHQKCKFGLSCTKVGCVYSHPSRQCKYHPFCTKPGCVYLHPTPAVHHHQPVLQVDTIPGKFTWRRQN